MPIYLLCREPAARFAASELRRYLARITGEQWIVGRRRTFTPGYRALWLGLLDDFVVDPATGEDPHWDDEVHIDVTARGGVIAGSNPRSLLMAVYRYLTEIGCRWVRPGRRGEHIPRLRQISAVRVREAASYRHRGVCIEGAVSYEHVRDMVDWLPKLGFNAYFLQFREAFNFFQRWYEHTGNPQMPARDFTVDEAAEFTDRVRAEVKKRGLLLHMVGHGWTCEPFGIPGMGWFQHKGRLPGKAIKHLAEIDGKRQLFGGIALNTNLCYGNPETRDIVTDAIAYYARENPDIDVLHFWLADGSNNQCECELCKGHRPSDLYVKMLNELDEKLTAEGIDTRIVFLAYVDLLWPPVREQFANPDRFILMFAPITRSYSTSFTAAGEFDGKLPPYRRNKLKFPSDPALNIAFLKGWQERFAGDSFDFDYHFMWDHYRDPGAYEIADVLHEDLRGLRDIGLEGFMSCQVQRVFFPSGYAMTVLGRTLWNRDLTLEEIAEDYFPAAFGARAADAREYLERISELFNPRLLRGEGTKEDKKLAPERLAQVPDAVVAMEKVAKRGTGLTDKCHARSWRLLEFHGEMCRLLSQALAEREAGNTEAAREWALKLVEWVRRAEPSIHQELDLYEFLHVVGGMLGLTGEEMGL